MHGESSSPHHGHTIEKKIRSEAMGLPVEQTGETTHHVGVFERPLACLAVTPDNMRLLVRPLAPPRRKGAFGLVRRQWVVGTLQGLGGRPLGKHGIVGDGGRGGGGVMETEGRLVGGSLLVVVVVAVEPAELLGYDGGAW